MSAPAGNGGPNLFASVRSKAQTPMPLAPDVPCAPGELVLFDKALGAATAAENFAGGGDQCALFVGAIADDETQA